MTRRAPTRQRGLTLVEVVISVVLLAGVLGSALALLDTSSDLAQSVNDERAAATRVDRALAKIADEFRKGSLASAAHLDETNFSDGDTGTGFRIRKTLGWDGGPILGEEVCYELVVPAGAAEGELVRREGAIETVLARGVTSFQVTRNGSAFDFTATAASGQTDDRRRTATGSLRVMARNP